MVPCQKRKKKKTNKQNTKKNHPLGVGRKYVEPYSLSNAMALDPEERMRYHINGKNKATVQFLKT